MDTVWFSTLWVITSTKVHKYRDRIPHQPLVGVNLFEGGGEKDKLPSLRQRRFPLPQCHKANLRTNQQVSRFRSFTRRHGLFLSNFFPGRAPIWAVAGVTTWPTRPRDSLYNMVPFPLCRPRGAAGSFSGGMIGGRLAKVKGNFGFFLPISPGFGYTSPGGGPGGRRAAQGKGGHSEVSAVARRDEKEVVRSGIGVDKEA